MSISEIQGMLLMVIEIIKQVLFIEVINPILIPGLLNTRWNPPNSLVFYPRSIKFGM